MVTQNIVSTPNITGNIGSCTSQEVSTVSGRTLFIEDRTNIITNSCTGEITQYYTWGFTGFSFLLLVAPIIILLIIMEITDKNSF